MKIIKVIIFLICTVFGYVLIAHADKPIYMLKVSDVRYNPQDGIGFPGSWSVYYRVAVEPGGLRVPEAASHDRLFFGNSMIEGPRQRVVIYRDHFVLGNLRESTKLGSVSFGEKMGLTDIVGEQGEEFMYHVFLDTSYAAKIIKKLQEQEDGLAREDSNIYTILFEVTPTNIYMPDYSIEAGADQPAAAEAQEL